MESMRETVPLSAVASVRGGKRKPPGTVYSLEPTGYRFLRGSDIIDGRVREERLVWLSEQSWTAIGFSPVREDEIALTIAGTVGKVAPLRGIPNCVVTDNIALLAPLPGSSLLPDFLSYLLQWRFMRFQMQKEMSELRQQKLSLEKLKLLRLPPVPSTEAQTAAMHDIGEGVERIHRTQRELEDLKRRTDMLMYTFLGLPSLAEVDVRAGSMEDEFEPDEGRSDTDRED
jgi:hypothetical protein